MARFLFVNRVYPLVPETTRRLLWELTPAAAGHDVTVLTMGGGGSPRPDGVTSA